MFTKVSKKMSLSLIMVLAFLAVFMITPALAVPGDLDPTFDGDTNTPGYPGNGKFTNHFNSNLDYAHAVAIQADKKIVVAGQVQNANGNHDVAVARYHPDGRLDTSFNSTGYLLTDINGGHDFGTSLAIQSDGKIVVGGHGEVTSGDQDFIALRYLSNGTLDTTFDTDGIAAWGYANIDDVSYDIVIQPNDKILLVGTTDDVLVSYVSMVRFEANGNLDQSFDGDPSWSLYPGNGVASTVYGGDNIIATWVAVQTDGKIVIGGEIRTSADNLVMVARYSDTGALDTGFDGDSTMNNHPGNGILEFEWGANTGDGATAVEVQPDGKIVVGGNSSNATDMYFALARLLGADGSLDTSFGTNGISGANPTLGLDLAHDMALESGGGIVMVGETYDASGGHSFAVTRHLSNGSPDQTFGSQGVLITDFWGQDDGATAVAIQPDKKIVVVGSSADTSGADWALARYEGLLGFDAWVDIRSLGGLSTFATDVFFPLAELNGANITLSATPEDWQVTDSSNSGAGWHVTLQADDFIDGEGHTLIVDSFFITIGAGDITVQNGNEPPTSLVQSPTSLNPDGVTILSADGGTGMGIYGIAPTFTLDIPGLTTYAGNYSTTIDVTTAAGP